MIKDLEGCQRVMAQNITNQASLNQNLRGPAKKARQKVSLFYKL